jgi:4-hydroxy-tetrahydrodipicolinate synthase
MAVSDVTIYSRTIVTFRENGDIDEEAFRQYLRRMADENLGVYIGACGPPEGFTLSLDEIARLYAIGVEECKGKVFVGGSGKEQHTAKDTLAVVKLGVEAGLDSINIYGPAGWHGYVPTEAEYYHYYDTILGAVDYPVSVAPNPAIGYRPEPRWVAEVCNRYPQVKTIILAGIYDDGFFFPIKDSLKRHDVDMLVTLPTAFAGFDLGARGLIAYQAQFIPKTYRTFIDLYTAGRVEEAIDVYSSIRKFENLVVSEPLWASRWAKMAARAFKLPGGGGTFREPHLMPEDHEIERFAKALIGLDIPEINEMAASAGLT